MFRKLVPSTVTTLVAGSMLVGPFVLPAQAQRGYAPMPLPASNQVSDSLTRNDLPTGQGSFARDYVIEVKNPGRVVRINLESTVLDPMVTLLGPDGTTIAENDDEPGGSTNSQLFALLDKAGTYTIRVQTVGEVRTGAFTLKVGYYAPVR
ncbi:PPC domain-containing protein [Leptolyngbya sp. FACHB-261]|uniref:PPC domain-containing protein n=1 Tax=Leptolyngbya sp. FACHB-261 TaxID=2692806 RepID=UPI00168768D4|nr:PPC domain-containing protein [Leptolyngbya sp. FACHB-261]MBD2100888.1 PPC domain-containing protein [Leptolyngbya sp. FACHB-261]